VALTLPLRWSAAHVCAAVLLQMVQGLPLPLLKICDFGYSKHDNRSVARSKVGTLTYMVRRPEAWGALGGLVCANGSC